MKDYFNSDELALHLAIIACQGECDKMIKRNCINEQERTFLKYASTYLQKFNMSVLGRLGAQYERKLSRTLKANNLLLVGKYAKSKETISECASEDILPAFNLLKNLRCADCNNECYKDCAVYSMGVACGVNANEDYCGKGCPFRWVNFED